LAAYGAFRMLVEECRTFQLPLQLMVGVSYRASPEGKGPPADLFADADPAAAYAELFRNFPAVTFCVSVLADGPHAELADLSKLFANVCTSGHGEDTSDAPAALERVLRERLQVVPQVKLIGYYTGMDRLEFALPLFNMYRRALAETLAVHYVRPRLYSV